MKATLWHVAIAEMAEQLLGWKGPRRPIDVAHGHMVRWKGRN